MIENKKEIYEYIDRRIAREVIVDKEEILDKTQKRVTREVNKMIKNISFTEKEKTRGWY